MDINASLGSNISQQVEASPASLAQAICEERARLGAGYQGAKDAFDTARTAIRQKVGTSSKAQYITLDRAADLAWDRLEHAIMELATHVRQHGCGECQDAPPSRKPIW